MKALLPQELRIGNLLKCLLTDKVESIYSILHKEPFSPSINGMDIEDFEPIPLNEEKLIEMGFEKLNFTFDLGKLSIMLPTRSFPYGRTFFNSWAIMEYAPKYVHHLQNLYFALHLAELTIKQHA